MPRLSDPFVSCPVNVSFLTVAPTFLPRRLAPHPGLLTYHSSNQIPEQVGIVVQILSIETQVFHPPDQGFNRIRWESGRRRLSHGSQPSRWRPSPDAMSDREVLDASLGYLRFLRGGRSRSFLHRAIRLGFGPQLPDLLPGPPDFLIP